MRTCEDAAARYAYDERLFYRTAGVGGWMVGKVGGWVGGLGGGRGKFPSFAGMSDTSAMTK